MMSAKYTMPKWKRSTLNAAVAVAISGMCAPAFALYQCGNTGGSISHVYGGYYDSVSAAQVLIFDGSLPVVSPGYDHSGFRWYGDYVYGLDVNGAMSGTLNIYSGTISAIATPPATNTLCNAYSAYAYGISMGSLAAGGVLTNSGTISAQSTTFAYGIYAGTLDDTLTNEHGATINASATNSAGGVPEANAYGVYVDGGIFALNNAGTISASAANSGSTFEGFDAHGSASGVYAHGGIAVLDNTNVISATATNSGGAGFSGRAHADAHGVHAFGGITTLSNTISISAVATNSGFGYAAEANAYGVNVESGNLGTLDNTSGILNAIAINSGSGDSFNGAPSARAYGVSVANGDLATLTNNSTINAFATNSGQGGIFSGGAYALANGVYVGGVLTDTLTNSRSGTISATAVDTNGYAVAYGVFIGTLDGILTNSGSISAVATGSTDSAYSYSIYIDGGTGSVNNLAGGLLSGNIYTYGPIAVSNAGTIALPAGANAGGAGVGHVFGAYTQSTGGVLQIGATNNTTGYGQLVVDGAVTFSGSNSSTIAVHVTPVNTLAAGHVLQDVVSAGSWFGLTSGGSVHVIGTPLFGFTGVEDSGGHIDITVSATTTFDGLYGSLGSLGRTLDGLVGSYGTGNAEMDALIDGLYGLDNASSLNNAIKQLQPRLSEDISQVTADTLHGTNNIIMARLDESRGLASGDNFVTNRNAWIKPLGSWANQKDNNLVSGYSAKSYGVVLGADRDISGASRLGAAFAFTNTKADSNDGWQNTKVNGYQLVLYGSHALDERTDLDWQADYGYNQNKGARITGGGTATADYTSSSMHAGLGVGRTMPMNPGTTFKPSLRADYTAIHENGYTETGAGAFNLVVDGRNTSEFILGIDGKVIHDLSDTSKLIANLGLGYDTQAEQASVTSSFQGGGAAFTTRGINPSKTTVRGGVGIVVNSNKIMEITARYDFESRSGFTGQTASLRLKIPF